MQAECAVKVLMRLYMAFDRDQFWSDPAKLADDMAKEGFGKQRVAHAIDSLRTLRMIERKEFDEGRIGLKISQYGIDWMEKNLPLSEKYDDEYYFRLPFFRNLTLCSPETFYGSGRATRADKTAVNWTKWGAVAGLVGIPIAIFTWWFS